MTLQGAGGFDDESVWYSWISLPSAGQSRHWYSPSGAYCFLKSRVQSAKSQPIT